MQPQGVRRSGADRWLRSQVRSMRLLCTFTKALLLVLGVAAILQSITAFMSNHPLAPEVAWARAIGTVALIIALITAVRWDSSRSWRWALLLPPITTVGITLAIDSRQSAPSMPLLFYALVPVFCGYVFRAPLAWLYTLFTILAVNVSAWDLATRKEAIHLSVFASCSLAFITALLLRSQGALEDVMGQYRDSAVRDDLTGLDNRSAFEQNFDQLLSNHALSATPAMLMLVDIQDFRGVNDRHGHPAGDRVLVDVARALRSTVGRTATLWRIGGNEFAVWFPGCDHHGAQWYRNLLTEEVAAIVVPGSPEEQVGVSVGHVVIPAYHHAMPREVLAEAGAQLKRFKITRRRPVRGA